MFRKRICCCVETICCRLLQNSTRSYFKYSHSYTTKGRTFPFTQTLVASAAALGISLYIAHKNKISCEIDLNPIKTVEILDEDKLYDKAIKKSRDVIQRIKDEYGIPGLVVGVSIDGRTVWKEGFGYADVENRVLCTSDTVMRIASISKSITMTAVAKLWEQGKLDLDKPVQEYVPYFPQKFYNAKPVTITCRQLVSHLGGIRHYSDEKYESKKTDGKSNNLVIKDEMDLKEYYFTIKYNDLQSALDMFKDDPLVENPGTKFLYSTHGWTLVSAIVEAVAKEPFTVHITKMFKTLGLNNTYLDENDVLIFNRSRNYMKNKKGVLINAPYVDNSYKWAGGGFLSTVGDLLRFANAMLYSFQVQHPNVVSSIDASPKKNSDSNIAKLQSNTDGQIANEKPLPGFLNSKTVAALWELAPPASNYGMGWRVNLQKQECGFCNESKFCVYHTGTAVGASSVVLIVPERNNKSKQADPVPKGIAVTILTNMHNLSLISTALEISKQFDKQ